MIKKTPARKGRPPMVLLLLLLLLLGAAVAVTVLNQRSVAVYDTHDHDRDGRPDHGPQAHR